MSTAPHNPTPLVVFAGSNTETERSRWARILWTAAILLTICTIVLLMFRTSAAESAAQQMPGAPMHSTAAPSPDTPVAVIGEESPEIGVSWDGPTVTFDWTGQQRLVAEETVIGSPVVVPGDVKQHTLLVRNDGPSAAVLDVWVNPHEIIPEDSVNADLASDVELFWDVDGLHGSQSFAELLTQDTTELAQIKVEQGETVAVTVGMRVDEAVERSQNEGADSRVLEFELGLAMAGELSQGADPLALTGGIHLGMLVVGAAVLFGSGLLILVWRRRRDDDEETVVQEQ